MAIIYGTDAPENLLGTFGADEIHGAGGDDIIHGNWGDDVLYGDAGNDYLAGENGVDIMHGGDGDDTILFSGGDSAFGGDGDDYFESDSDGYAGATLDGGAGFDIVDLNRSMSNTMIYLDDAVGTGLRISNIELLRVGYSSSIFGGSRNDTIEAGSSPYQSSVFHGGGGDDVLSGYRYADFLYGDAGDDIIDGSSGSNTLDGGDGFDFVDYSDREWATVDLGVSTAQSVANYTTDALMNFEGAIGGGGRDEFYGAAGANTLIGGGGDDHLDGRDGDDTLNGGLGDDVIIGGAGWDTLLLDGTRNDYVVLRSGEDYIVKGLDGWDRVSGVEILQFSDGSVIDLARQAEVTADGESVDGPFVLPALPDDQPLVLPGDAAVKFVEEPQVLPGAEDRLSMLGLEARLAHVGGWLMPADHGLPPEPERGDWLF